MRFGRVPGARAEGVAVAALLAGGAGPADTQTPTPASGADTTSSAMTSSAMTSSGSGAILQEVHVRGTRELGEPASVVVRAPEASALAGTEGDPVKALEDLPGVGRPTFGAGPLVLWGASAGDSAVFVDGVPIPLLFHSAGVRSTLGPDFVRDVTLVPGAYGPDVGRALGGVVRVETRGVPDEGLHARVRADVLDGSAFATAALTKGVRGAAFARVGWLDALARAAHISAVDRTAPIPRYADGQAKIEVDLDPGERLMIAYLGSCDASSETALDPDPLRDRTQTTATRFARVYVRYRRTSDEGVETEVLPWIGHDDEQLGERFGASPASLSRSTWRGGLRANSRSPVAPWAAVVIGADLEASNAILSRKGSLTLPTREGDVRVFGQPPGSDVAADTWSVAAVAAAPYVMADLTAGPLHVVPSLRLDAFVTGTSRSTPRLGETPAVGLSRLDTAFEPRIAARWHVTPRLSIQASAGLYTKPVDAADQSAVFGNPNLAPEGATHAAVGESLLVIPSLTADVTLFGEWMHDLVVRNPAATPPLTQALVQGGAGRSVGLQVFVRQRRAWRGLTGWVSCTLSRSERRDEPSAAWRLFDGDQPLLLSAVARQVAGPWTFGLRFRFASGLPRTPVVGAFYDATDDRFDPVFGPQNSIRLPDFWALDVRIDRRFDVRAGVRGSVYLEGLNVTGRSNAEDYAYSVDYARRGIVGGLPLIASIGAEIEQ